MSNRGDRPQLRTLAFVPFFRLCSAAVTENFIVVLQRNPPSLAFWKEEPLFCAKVKPRIAKRGGFRKEGGTGRLPPDWTAIIARTLTFYSILLSWMLSTLFFNSSPSLPSSFLSFFNTTIIIFLQLCKKKSWTRATRTLMKCKFWSGSAKTNFTLTLARWVRPEFKSVVQTSSPSKD